MFRVPKGGGGVYRHLAMICILLITGIALVEVNIQPDLLEPTWLLKAIMGVLGALLLILRIFAGRAEK